VQFEPLIGLKAIYFPMFLESLPMCQKFQLLLLFAMVLLLGACVGVARLLCSGDVSRGGEGGPARSPVWTGGKRLFFLGSGVVAELVRDFRYI